VNWRRGRPFSDSIGWTAQSKPAGRRDRLSSSSSSSQVVSVLAGVDVEIDQRESVLVEDASVSIIGERVVSKLDTIHGAYVVHCPCA
jgi:hypothetical protein